jgi:hypothetical protein
LATFFLVNGMHAKILRPKDHGKLVYNNQGSAQRTVNYLQKEAKENQQEATFFGSAGKAYTAEEVVALLDKNHRGLRKDEEKFHSLVFSPSVEETARLGNDPQALQRYTQQAMELYAKNFKLKEGRELGENELVWAAVIHQERKNRGTDHGMQGEQKPGLQTHVHVIVSARDDAQQHTLHPNTTLARFNRVEFQAQVNVLMEEHTGRNGATEIGSSPPSREKRVAAKVVDIKERAAAQQQKKVLTSAQGAAKDARLEGQTARINSKLDATQQLDPERVKEAAKARGYDNIFYARLGQLEKNAEKKKYTPQPYAYLSTGKVQRVEALQELPGPLMVYVTPAPRPQKQPTISPAFHALARSIEQLSYALAPQSRPQEVRSEEEKAYDYEHEM